jgi:ABC-type multidrug transport system permease subunit
MSTAPHQKIRHQTSVLTKRYRAVMFGDLGTVALLLLQAPFIGWLCTLVWGSIEKDTPSLYFVLSLSAVWFGCINACREIVKERSIVERERLLGLSLVAYIASRFSVLSVLGFLQVLMLQIAVEWSLSLKGIFVVQTMALWLATLCGIGLGLVVSALSHTQERAVGAIPLIVLPQILFSEFSIPRENFGDTVLVIEKCMPVRWCYEIFQELAALETAWGTVLLSFSVLIIMIVILAALACLTLLRQREVV